MIKSNLTITNGQRKLEQGVLLNEHLSRKMEQAQRNMMRLIRSGYRPRRRVLYWSRQFRKWSDLLITRAEVIE